MRVVCLGVLLALTCAPLLAQPQSLRLRDGSETAIAYDSLDAGGVGLAMIAAKGSFRVVAPAGAALTLHGWAFDKPASKAASGIAALVDDELVARGTIGLERPDVARVWGNPALARSGFALTIPADDLMPGRHRVTLFVEAADERSAFVFRDQFDVLVTAPQRAPLRR